MKNYFFLFVLIFFLPNRMEAYDDGIRITWDYSQCKYLHSGVYARIKKLSNNDLILVYSASDKVYSRVKKAGLTNWEPFTLVSSDNAGHYGYTNSELIELANGKLIYAWNGRPKTENVYPYTIMIKMSDDKGATWYGEQTVYSAGKNWGEGCWEPALLQLPSGEVQIYFANEAPFPSNSDQEITLIRSFNNGAAWSSPSRISYRSGRRDGMPVPVCLQDNKGIVFAIEDNGINGTFKPVIIYSSLENNWQNGVVSGSSPNRWHALRSDYQLASNIYAGAPYLIQLSSKETVLSVQSGENRETPNSEAHANMQVYIGDSEARNFSRKSTPFAYLPANANALWSALCQIDDSTVMAISSISGVINSGINSSTGRIMKPLEIEQGTAGEWGSYTSIFIGAQSQASMQLKSRWNADSLYLKFDVKDKTQTIAPVGSPVWDTDGVEIYLDPKNINTNTISTGAYKLLANINGESLFCYSAAGEWGCYTGKARISIDRQTSGYAIEISVPWSDLGEKPSSAFGVHLKLHNNDNGVIIHEDLSGGNPDRPRTWMKASLEQTLAIEEIEQASNNLILQPSVLKAGEPFQIRIPSGMGNLPNTHIKIYNTATGSLLYNEKFTNNPICIENFSYKGAFLVVAETKKNQLTGKLIVY